MFQGILENVRSKAPIVHAITNYVTVNDCANVILASGGSPVMADSVHEVCDITAISSSLVINMGTLGEDDIKAMVLAGKKAGELAHPIIFDPVGAGAAAFRNETAAMLLREVPFSVIRGNISEIKFLADGTGNTQGVDASADDAVTSHNINKVISLAGGFARRTGAVIAITGAIDVVSDGNKTFIIQNGHPLMSRVTGTGCMLTALIGSYCGANSHDILSATAAAVAVMGLCGELAYKKLCALDGGVGTYRTLLIDYIGKIDKKMLKDGVKIESK